MLLEIEETGRFECFYDGDGDGMLISGGSVEKGTEVNDLQS